MTLAQRGWARAQAFHDAMLAEGRVPAPEPVTRVLVDLSAALAAAGVPEWWILSRSRQWHLLRPDARRLFCGRPPRGTRWRRLAAPIPVDPPPHAFLGPIHVGTAPLALERWPDYSCWACMDVYVSWAVRAGLYYPLDAVAAGVG